MKTEFKAKLLQHLAKKEEKGFTLIELLVVIIIIGILSAIALPSFLNQANKAKQSEAKQYVGSMNRAQQAYYLEQSTFGSNLQILGLGIQDTTTNYTYTVVGGSTVSEQRGTSVKAPLRTYAGAVYTGAGSGGDTTTLATLCETTAGTTTAITFGSTTTCPSGSAVLTTK